MRLLWSASIALLVQRWRTQCQQVLWSGWPGCQYSCFEAISPMVQPVVLLTAAASEFGDIGSRRPEVHVQGIVCSLQKMLPTQAWALWVLLRRDECANAMFQPLWLIRAVQHASASVGDFHLLLAMLTERARCTDDNAAIARAQVGQL